MHSCILIHKLQLRNDYPWQEPFRAVLPLAMFGQVDGQHLITCRAGLLCKCKGFLFAAHFAMDIKINFSAFFPVQQSRNTADLNLLCFHRNISCQMPPSFRYSGWLKLFTLLSPPFIVIVPMITHFPFKHKQKEL